MRGDGMTRLADILIAHPIATAGVGPPPRGSWDCYGCGVKHDSWAEYVAHVIEAIAATDAVLGPI